MTKGSARKGILIMLFYSVLLLCLIHSSITEQVYGRESSVDLNDAFPSWPFNRQAAKMTIQKRQAEGPPLKPVQSETPTLHVDSQSESKNSIADGKRLVEQVSEGDVELKPMPNLPPKQTSKLPDATPVNTNISVKTEPSPVSGNATQNTNGTVSNSTIPPTIPTKVSDSTAPKAPSYQPDLSNPGVMKRGLIVFGAFALMAVAYFIFYRRKSKKNDSNNTHGTNDTNQFRYGVLQSEDRRDNLELSRIPLTMESDEDEDEDLEIFDLKEKKKSLSYVNLQTNDDYIVHESRETGRDRDNLLLDIDDANSDQLINWSSNGNKSIL